MLAQKERALQSNPYDATTAQQVDTLVQVSKVVLARALTDSC